MLCRPGPSTYARPDCKAKPCKMGTNPGRTHRFYTGEAVTPFGTGLSYTTFDYKIVSGPAAPVSLDFVIDLHSHSTAMNAFCYINLEACNLEGLLDLLGDTRGRANHHRFRGKSSS